MTYHRLSTDDHGNVVFSNYNSNGDWVGDGPDPRVLNESIMEDDDKVIGSYWYIMDGKVTECQHFNGDANAGISVEEYKRRYGVSEIKRCDITRRFRHLKATPEMRSDWERNFHTQMRDSVKFSEPLQPYRDSLEGKPHHYGQADRTFKQAKRRPRSSNKIKKVK